MASKKVIVNIKVTQDGAKVSDVTKDVKKLTDAEKERIKVRNELKKTDAQIEIVNEDITKTLKERKSVLKDLASQQLTSSQIAKIAAKKKKEDTEEQIRIEKKAFNEKKRIESNNASIDAQRSRALISQFNAQEKLTQKTIESAQAQELLNKNLQQFKTTSGLSGAIVTEFGRTVSDLPFGIRGVGNNLAQLGSLFGSLAVNAKKAGGGIKDAIGQILVSFKGIVGFITVFQVFVALLQTEFFQKFLSGLAKSVGLLDLFKDKLQLNIDLLNSQSELLGNSLGSFKVYIGLLKDANTTEEERVNILSKLNDEYPDFNTNLIDSTEAQKDQNEAISDYISLLQVRARSEAAQSLFQEKEVEKTKLKSERLEGLAGFGINTEEEASKRLIEIEDTLFDFYDEINGVQSSVFKQAIASKFGVVALQDEKEAIIEAFTVNEDEIEKISKEQEFLLSQIDPSSILGKISNGSSSRELSERRVKRFKEGNFSLEQELNRSQDDLKKTTFRTNKEILEDEGENAEKSIKIKTDEFIRKEELRLKDFIKQKKLDLKRKGITENESNLIKKSISEAEALSAKTITSAEKESQAVISSISNVTQARIDNRAKLDALNQGRLDDSVEEGGLGTLANLMSNGLEKIRVEEELARLTYENKVARADEEISLLTTTEDRRRELETQKQIWTQDRAKEDLAFKIANIEEEANIQKEYISFVSGVSGILQGISNKNKEWQKAQLILEKGAAIANVVVNASKSIFASKAAAKAVPSFLPFSGLPNPLKAAALLSSKADQVKTKISAGVSIAAITAAGISRASAISNSGGGDSGASSAGGSPQQAPDFNIIGSTGVNQLADAIGGTTGQSVKAYVVSSDITNQQALDRSINESAQI